MRYYPAPWHGDGTKGCCNQSGDLKVYSREDECDCGKFLEMPKMERLGRRINHRLHNWVRERDSMFCRAMEIVGHICELFKQGEFKVFDVVKSASDMKALIYNHAAVITPIYKVWTYHCPWNEEYEHFIVLTENGKMVVNAYIENKFVTQWFDVEDLDLCFSVIDKIRDNCIMKANVTDYVTESEYTKCVSDGFEWKTLADTHPINREDSIIRYPR